MNEDVARGYLAALIDGEGSVSFYDYRKRESSPGGVVRCITIYNSEPSIFDGAEEALKALGFRYCRYSEHGRKTHTKMERIQFGGQDQLWRVRTEIPLRSAVKLVVLDALLASYVQRRRVKRPPLDTLELLRAEGLNRADIARRYGVASQTVGQWFHHYDQVAV